ncbi:hypothetical protein EPN42_14010 [bacterium]|nr:MAG: hypothetical protein EPN42_14010 [bacterium]
MRTPWFAVVALGFTLLVAIEGHRGGLEQGSFKAFYCAGSAIASGANPYLVEPSRSCYHRVDTTTHIAPGGVEPAPLPGYALAPFVLLSSLPVRTAQALFTVLLIAALITSAWLIGSLTRVPYAVVLLGLLPLGYLNIAYGEIPPLLLAALTGAGYLLARRRWAWASVVAAGSMIEPHVGLAACLAMFLFVPRCRLPLLLCGVALAALSVATLGIAENWAYLGAVLPSQAIAELVANDQYSLSRILSIAGVQDRTALLLGSLSYALMLALGVMLARRLARRLKAPELVIWFPAAAVLFGGTFVHDVQMIAALPAAFALAARARRLQALAYGALVALAFAWTLSAGRMEVLLSITSSVAIVALGLAGAPHWRRLTVALSAGVVIAGALLIAQYLVGADPGHARSALLTASASMPDALASVNWGAYLRAMPTLSTPSLGIELLKLPTWAALITLVIVASRQAPREARAS